MKRIIPSEDRVLFYTLSDPKTKEVKYVGKTWTTLAKRLSGHICKAKTFVNNYKQGLTKTKPSKLYEWVYSLVENGDFPEINILDEECREEWEFWEKYWIEQFLQWNHDLVNTCKGGRGSVGHKHNEDVKQRLSEINKGKKPSIQTIQASIEYNNKSIIQYTKEMKFLKIWKSIKNASEETNIHYNSISNALCGRAKSAGGYLWLYN